MNRAYLEKKMTPLSIFTRTLLWPLAFLVSPGLLAQSLNAHTGIYLGLGAGESKARIDSDRIRQGLLDQGLSTSTLTEDGRDTGYKAYVGIPIHPNWAVEAGYFDLGRFGFDATTAPVGGLTGSARMRGLNLDLVGFLPITERWSLMGRVGAAYAQTQDRFSGTGAVTVTDPSPSRRETNYKYGFGTQYAFTPALSLRLEAERYRVNDAIGQRGDVDLYTLGLIYRFGGPAAPAPTVAYTPYVPPAEPMALAQAQPPAPAPAPLPPPEPAPVVLAPPIPAPEQTPAPAPWVKLKLEADSLFGFDQDSLQADGKKALDQLILSLQRVDIEAIEVTGHTDRLGRKAYNDKLSLRRAEAVKSYLVQMGGISAPKINTTGMGATRPETSPSECQGTQASRALITCLRADRRVEVKVSGQQQP
jgi:OOP family OmpA-OmpF porin